MATNRRVSLSVSEKLLAELDTFAGMDRRRRDELLGEALGWYLKERKRIHLHNEMRRGYEEMAAINLRLAGDCVDGEVLVDTDEW